MSATVMLTCDVPHGVGTCPERTHVTADEIRTMKDHPDASPRWGDLDIARRIAAARGWSTRYQPNTRSTIDCCSTHSGHKPRR
ncbi:hypothetical protein [Nocardiopsis synnemataformans]|uniref:hypothetical protein n=1 Tax=Nocardiopsis synnemataformans TaxID=61305 RepID=UPI003EBF3F14